LRAIAVLLVVLYHAGFSQFQNGFLGVDIFFVVSGYLMATLYSGAAAGTFFKARIRRLAPTLGLISLATLLISFAVVTPFQFKEISKETILGITGTSNFYFWSEDTYFAPGRFRPLLHLWTLSLELQFYLLFPLLSRITKGKKWLWLVLLTISFSLSQLILYKSPKTSFFLLPTRFWEFAFGVIAAGITGTILSRSKKSRKSLAMLSVIGITLALKLTVDPNSANGLYGHPGISALLIVFSTALLLSLGIESKESKSILSRMALSIGNASYAIYLIHYPIFIAINYSPYEPSSTHIEGFTMKVVGVLCAVIFGIVITNQFERPMLNSQLGIKKIFIAGLTLGAICVALIPINRSLSTTSSQNISASLEDRSVYRCGKLFRILNPNSNICEITQTDKQNSSRVLLLGNSHADAVKLEMSEVAKSENFNLFFWVDNNPFSSSSKALEAIVSEIEEFRIDIVVLHSSYGYPNKWEIDELIRLTERLGTKLFMVESVPTYLESVPILEFKKSQGEKISFADFVNPESIYLQEDYSEIQSPRFRYIPSQQVFCKVECNWGTTQGMLFYFDSNHLTLTGAKLLNPVLRQIDYVK
jgi:peptidoglycan/LPS O-acetylase OafA/YrhL